MSYHTDFDVIDISVNSWPRARSPRPVPDEVKVVVPDRACHAIGDPFFDVIDALFSTTLSSESSGWEYGASVKSFMNSDDNDRLWQKIRFLWVYFFILLSLSPT